MKVKKQELLDLVVDLALEVAETSEWEMPNPPTKETYYLIATSMLEIHLGDRKHYDVVDVMIPLLATSTFLCVQNMVLLRLLMGDGD